MSNNPFGSSFEDALEQGFSQVKQQTQTAAKSVQTQMGVPPAADQSGVVDTIPGLTDQFNETSSQNSSQDPAQQQALMHQAEVKDQKERQEKLEETRKKLQEHQSLHKKTYYDPTFVNRPKELSVQEKLAQEEQKEEEKKMEEIQEEQKKAPPIALQRAKTGIEMNRGASG